MNRTLGPRTRTLRGRIALVATAVTAAWVVTLAIGVNLVLAWQLLGQADSVLRTRAEAIASTVEISTDGQVGVRAVRDDTASDVGTWIFAGDDVLEAPTATTGPATDLFGSDPLGSAARDLAGRGERATTIGTADPVRLYALPVSDAEQQVATVVATLSLAPYRQSQNLSLAISGLLAVLLLLGVYLVLRVSTDRALRPVQEMTEQAARWSADDVARRFGPADRPAELQRLAGTLDGLLDRLSAVLRHEQTFTAELSHELRTPLAAIVAETTLLGDRPRTPAETTDAITRIAEGADRMTRILDTLLSAARATAGTPPGRCDLHTVVDGLAERWTHPVPLVTDVPAGTIVGADPDLVGRLLSPVLDNAARYARTRITLRARSTPREVTTDITDDGPGITPDDLDRIFEPGWRAHHDGTHHGAGLGLALVRRLASAAGGTAAAQPGEEGATIRLILPAG